jgi:hypothetical protein
MDIFEIALQEAEGNSLIVNDNSQQFEHNIMVFWVVTPCRLVGGYRRFGATYHHKLLCMKTQPMSST